MILTPEQVARIRNSRIVTGGGCVDTEAVALADSHEALRATNTELNRRCQLAESAARENVETVLRAGMPLGRTLAHFAAMDARRECEALRVERDNAIAAEKENRNDLMVVLKTIEQNAELRAERDAALNRVA